MSQISPERPVKILLVEDDLALLEVVRDILSDAGYEVMTATNGREGL
ncbi:hypothetical protein [Anaerolinea thermophila]|nr:hypothetical protein [Anaerolinea thermophila]